MDRVNSPIHDFEAGVVFLLSRDQTKNLEVDLFNFLRIVLLHQFYIVFSRDLFNFSTSWSHS